jgi:hypothetical protein
VRRFATRWCGVCPRPSCCGTLARLSGRCLIALPSEAPRGGGQAVVALRLPPGARKMGAPPRAPLGEK